MNSKQVKSLRKEMKRVSKFTLSRKDGYKPDYRVLKEKKKTIYFKDKKQINEKEAEKLRLSGDNEVREVKTTMTTAINTAKYQYQRAKNHLGQLLRENRG